MKKIFTVIATIVMGLHAMAQETSAPDYKQIEKDIQDKNSAFYYPSLKARYAVADKTLTIDELRHLYYGSALIVENTPTEAAAQALENFGAILKKENPTPNDYLLALKYSDTLIKYKPYSILLKHYRVFCLKEMGRYDEAIVERDQIEMIAEAILSSGNGASETSSIHVVDIDNEDDAINLLNFTVAGNGIASTSKEAFVPVEQNIYNQSGVYFYVYQPNRAVSGL